jgi:transcriptional regulator with XRE-family HTH domain
MKKVLRDTRLNKCLKQTELAALIGLTKQGYWDIEHGRSKGSVNIWDKLEEVLGVDQKILRQVDDTTSSNP